MKFRQSLTSEHKNLLAKDPVLFIQSMKDYEKYTFTSNSTDAFGFWDKDNSWEWHDATPFLDVAGQKLIHEELYYIQLLWPQPNLYIIGAGADARPLAQFAKNTGYMVHLLDWRESLCQRKHFPSATSIQVGNIQHMLNEILFNPLDSVVVMTHDFQQDVAIVNRLKDMKFLYIGVLGSKNRTERLLDGPIPDRCTRLSDFQLVQRDLKKSQLVS